MADSNTLRSFFVDLGFRPDQSQLDAFLKALARTDKAQADLNRNEGAREKDEKKRAEDRARRIEDLQRGAARFALGVAASATAASYAFERLTAGLDRAYFTAARTGGSSGKIAGLSYAFRQLGGTAEQAVGTIEAFAKAVRTNPGIEGFIKSLGVATKDAKGQARDTVDVMLEAVEAARKKHPYYTAAQMAELFGVSEETFKLIDQYRDRLPKLIEEHRRMAKSLGMDFDQATKDADRFQTVFRKVQEIVSLAALKIAADLAPIAEKHLKALTDWIAAHPKEVEEGFKTIGTAATALAEGVGAVGKAVAPLAEGFVHVAEAVTGEKGTHAAFKALGELLGAVLIVRLAKVLGLLQVLRFAVVPPWLLALLGVGAAAGAQAASALGKGGLPAGVDPITGEAPGDQVGGGLVKPGEEGGLKRWWKRTMPGWLGGDSGGIRGRAERSARLRSQGAVSGVQAERERRAMARLIAHGWTPEAAATAIGQAVEESSVRSDGPLGDTGRFGKGDDAAHGLFQWRGARFRALKAFAAQRNKPWTDFDTQIDFFNEERKQRSAAEGQWHKETDLDRGNRIGKQFEQYGGPLQQQRREHARRLLEDYKRGRRAPVPAPEIPSPPVGDKPTSGSNGSSPGQSGEVAPPNLSHQSAAPLGTASSSVFNTSRTISQQNPVNVTVHGASDPDRTGKAVERAVRQTSELHLQSLQSAIS